MHLTSTPPPLSLYRARLYGKSQLRLSHIATLMRNLSLNASGDDAISEDELECLVAVLIARKLVRGYLSHSPLILVLARENAFPRLSSGVAGSVPIRWWERST